MDIRYLKIIESDRVTSNTREVLLRRAHSNAANEKYIATCFTPNDFSVLQAILRRLIPQDEIGDLVDIASSIDRQLSANHGDGWRYAVLPPDIDSLNLGLRLLDATAQRQHQTHFTSLDESVQITLLKEIQLGEIRWSELDGRRWFEDLLAQATEVYVSDPTTLAEMGFSGIAFLPAWPEIGLNSGQSWEPKNK